MALTLMEWLAIKDAIATGDDSAILSLIQRQEPKERPEAELGVRFLVEQGVNEQDARDWLRARKASAKKAPLTMAAWRLVMSEAKKAGITPPQAVAFAAERSWRGFKADWYTNEMKAQRGEVDDWRKSSTGITKKGEELGIERAPGELFPNFRARVHMAAGEPLQ